MKKIKVLHQVLDPRGSGGVSAEFRALQNSALMKSYEFEAMVLYTPHRLINYRDILFYYRRIRESAPDIIHIRGAALDGLNAVIAAKLYGKAKIFVAVHGMQSDNVYASRIKRWINKYVVERLTFLLCDGISCVSKNISDRKYFDRYRDKMLPFVYNRMPFFDENKAMHFRTEIRQKYQIADSDLVFAFIGRLSKEKGLDDMFMALDLIEKQLPSNFVLLVVGGGDYYEQCVEKYKSRPYRVVFTNNQLDTERFFRAADVFVLPSLHENHSIALLEACAAHLPCIATDCGGNSETIENKCTGIIVPVGDVRQLSEAMASMLESSYRNYYSENMKMYDFTCFSDSACDSQLDMAYQTILNK